MKMAMKDGKIMLIEVDNTQMAIIKSWNSMKYDRRKNMMIGDCSKELLDKLSKIVRLPPAIESYRQRLDETQRAVDKMRVEKEPEALVKYPVQVGFSAAAATYALRRFAEALKTEPLSHLTNNWRKMHGLPMHRKPAAFRRRRKGNGTGKQSK